MLKPDRPGSELVKTILEPLLNDFQYWFSRSRQFLETEEIGWLGTEKQADLLGRIVVAQAEVQTVQSLLKVTDGRAGVEMAVLTPWHHLVTECWQVVMRHRIGRTPDKGS